MSVLRTTEVVIRLVITQMVVIYVAVKVDGNWTTINIPVKVGETHVHVYSL